MSSWIRRAVGGGAAITGAVGAACLLDFVAVQHTVEWADVGEDNVLGPWLFLSRPLQTTDAIAVDQRYVVRDVVESLTEPGRSDVTHRLVHLAAGPLRFINNGSFAETLIPPRHCVVTDVMSAEAGDELRKFRCAEPTSSCHPVSMAWFHPLVTEDDTTHYGSLVSQPVLRLWPLPVARVPCREVLSSASDGLDHLAPMLRRWLRSATPHVDDAAVNAGLALSSHPQLEPERVSTQPQDVWQASLESRREGEGGGEEDDGREGW
jgi:hypothetical protein